MQMKNSIIWRMLAWFLLLALIPLGTVIIFVQRQVNQTVLDVELQAAVKEARLHAAESAYHPDAFEQHTQIYEGSEEVAFILGTDGTYLAHTDRQKIGTSAGNDFTDEILGTFFSSESGSLDNTDAGQIIGYAAIPGQNSVMVIVKDNQAIQNTLNSLSRSIFLQLSVILLITSIVSGVAILAVINPLRQLANFADQVGSGNLDATIDQTDLEGEIAVLANSLSNMTARLRDLIYQPGKQSRRTHPRPGHCLGCIAPDHARAGVWMFSCRNWWRKRGRDSICTMSLCIYMISRPKNFCWRLAQAGKAR